ncbi:hypothetical protein [Methylobacterium sp. PvR107]|nr:hypothetical protein [Methylobacterium sp. PvR107]MBP1181178.1 hypothetical protein [Methylobacterium sp. PvR107]
MKNVTVTMSEALLQRARVAAARDGKSLSQPVALHRRGGRAAGGPTADAA